VLGPVVLESGLINPCDRCSALGRNRAASACVRTERDVSRLVCDTCAQDLYDESQLRGIWHFGIAAWRPRMRPS